MRAGSWALVVAAAALTATAGLAQRPELPVRPAVPDDPAVGAWRGTVAAGSGESVPLVLSVVRRGGDYAGAINIGGANEAPLQQIAVDGNRVTLATGAESRLGQVALTAVLELAGNTLGGGGTLELGPLAVPVTIALDRQARADVLQPTVEQRAEYFVGRWSFEYLGAEAPPLSPGSRAGTAAFESVAPGAVTGRIEADVDGTPHHEQWSMTFDPATQMLAVLERHGNGPELLSVADWRTPLAIRFSTAPVMAGGKTYQLRRLIQVLSDVSFTLTDELSVDGGPFRRLGNATFEKSE